jgi:hypothetical protein
MEIIVRINPQMSPTANDWAKNKEQLMETCFTSLLAVGGYAVKKHFILDNCPEEWVKFFKIYGETYEVNLQNKAKTVDLMFQVALANTSDEIVFFLEDDYLWRNDARLEDLEKACKEFGAVTPYDHPDHYLVGNRSFLLKIFDNKLWRSCTTTTHTFAVKRQILKDHWDDFHYGDHDWQMWTKLSMIGIDVYSPVYSMATHLAKGHEALHYNWKEYFDILVENNAIMAKGIKSAK